LKAIHIIKFTLQGRLHAAGMGLAFWSEKNLSFEDFKWRMDG
jgi:hypothetical protein